MRIAIITDFVLGQYYGGGEKRYFEIWKRLVPQGFLIDVFCMKSDKSEIQYPPGINIIKIGPTIKNPPQRTLLQMIHFVISTYCRLLFSNYDIYEAQGVGILSLFFLRLFGKKNTISLIHDLSSGKSDQWISSGKISELFEKMIYRLPTHKVLTVSNNIKKRLIDEYKIRASKISVIYNGIDDVLIDSVKGSKRSGLIYVGRLIPHKHVEDLLSILSKLSDLPLQIIGQGSEGKKLINLVEKLNLNERVTFHGTVNDYKDVISKIKSSKILVLPSTREGFGLVLTEAMYCGTPVVAYESDGASEIIDDNINGYLIEQRNIEALKDKINYILSNQIEIDKIVLKAKEKVKSNFLWSKTVDNLINFYKNG